MRRTISHPSCCREPMVPAGSTETGQQTSWCCRCRNFASKQGWSQGKAVPTYHQAPWRYKCVQGEGEGRGEGSPQQRTGPGFYGCRSSSTSPSPDSQYPSSWLLLGDGAPSSLLGLPALCQLQAAPCSLSPQLPALLQTLSMRHVPMVCQELPLQTTASLTAHPGKELQTARD